MSTSPEMIAEEVNYTHACCIQHFGFTPSCSAADLIRHITSIAARTRPLSPGEQGIITLMKPKTAALFANRVWLPFPGEEPELDFVFGWESPVALRLAALLAFMKLTPNSPLSEAKQDSAATPPGAFEEHPRVRAFLAFTEGDLVADYSRLTGAMVCPLYSHAESRDADYRPGNHAVVTSVIENVGLVSEADLTWEQVSEFRNDQEARSAYRRFVHWLDKDLVGRPTTFVENEVAYRLESYRWAIKKHGMQTLLGTLERTLDAKDLLGASVAAITLNSFAQMPIASALAGAGVLVGQTAIRIGTQLIERKEAMVMNREVAFVHHLTSELPKKPHK